MPNNTTRIQGIINALNRWSYPTKETIMGGETVTHKAAVIKLVKLWKKEVWKDVKQAEIPSVRFEALRALIIRIATEGYQRPVEVVYNAELLSPCYDKANNRIILNKKLSIISSLHELGHHLFGPDETKACRWSVHLFKKAFPKAFDKLEFKGHMLVRKTEEVCSVS